MALKKKIGIKIDDYKQKRYESELHKLHIKDFRILRFSEGIKLIKIRVDRHRVREIGDLCQRLEKDFKAKRN